MKIFLHNNFIKQYKKLSKKQQEQFKKRRNLFLENPFNPIHNNHSLRGEYDGYRSINITGDLRVLYEILGKNAVLFITIGTHSELYRK